MWTKARCCQARIALIAPESDRPASKVPLPVSGSFSMHSCCMECCLLGSKLYPTTFTEYQSADHCATPLRAICAEDSLDTTECVSSKTTQLRQHAVRDPLPPAQAPVSEETCRSFPWRLRRCAAHASKACQAPVGDLAGRRSLSQAT